MIPLPQAQARIAGDINPLEIVDVPLAEALGLVLAEEIEASEAIPPFANTAMDGFALRAKDIAGASSDSPVRLSVVATIAAGSVAPRSLAPGEAMRIMTGAPIPDGADAVVMVELTDTTVNAAAGDAGQQEAGQLEGSQELEAGRETVAVKAEVAAGNHIRPAGDDLKPGTVIFSPGEELTPAHIGVMASIGPKTIKVHRRPRVGVFSTGDELVVGPEPLQPGQIRDSNRPSLLSLVREAGCTPIDLGCLRDNEAEIEQALSAAVRPAVDSPVDALITTGGVSMGDFDFVKKVLSEIGDMSWMQVAIKPAKPLAFGLLNGVPIFGLPGNPVSSMVSFELFARPSLLTMMGRKNIRRATVRARASEPLRRSTDGKTHFARVIVSPQPDGALAVRSAGGQGSHQLSSMARANGLAILADGSGVDEGGQVKVMLLGELPGGWPFPEAS